MPLTAPNGTVNVPVSALAGAGTYTLWIDLQPGTTAFGSDISDLAFTRVDAGTARPPAPLLSLPHDPSAPVHTLLVPYRSPFVVSYDVSHVPGATGAIVELSAPPPSPFFYRTRVPRRLQHGSATRTATRSTTTGSSRARCTTFAPPARPDP